MSAERGSQIDPSLESKPKQVDAGESDKNKEKKRKDTCDASPKERRKCPIVTPNYESCHKCPYCGIEEGDINLGQPGLRGGIEDSRDSAAWRKNKLIHGIPHGDD